MEISIESLDSIGEVARQFIAAIGDRRVFAFYGAMGAGKTTFIKAVCEQLGVTEQVTSPTFAIVNVYECGSPSTRSPLPTGEGFLDEPSGRAEQGVGLIYHFDFYRIKRLEEAYDMGCEEYFYSGCLCFIEWPELIEDILPPDTVRVDITHPNPAN